MDGVERRERSRFAPTHIYTYINFFTITTATTRTQRRLVLISDTRFGFCCVFTLVALNTSSIPSTLQSVRLGYRNVILIKNAQCTIH